MKTALLLLTLALPSLAFAAGGDYVTVLGGYLVKPSKNHVPELKNGIGADFRYGNLIAERWSCELRGFYGTLKPKASGSGNGFHSGVGVDALFRLGELFTVTPYLIGGGGLAYSDLASGTLNDPRAGLMLDLGGGVFTSPFAHVFGRALSARAEVKGDYEHYDRGYLDVRAYLGLQLALSEPKAPAPAPEPVSIVQPVAPAADSNPVPQPAAPEPVPAPAEPPCKAPEPGEKVSLKGCGTGDKLVLRGVTFDFNKASLTANAKVLLDDIASELAKYPDIKVEVGGHTDSKGSHAYNQRLSEKRAAAVVDYLASKGFAGDRTASAGYAETQPVADNDTDEGRERNRRVELKITEGTAKALAEDAAH